MKNLCKTISTLGFVGYLPTPGTFGSLVGLLFVLLLNYFKVSFLYYVLINCAFLILSFFIIKKTLLFFNSKDPSQIVLDEFVSVLIAFLTVKISYFSVLFIFLMFRFFDIFKPFGIKFLERNLNGAWGIVLDDVLAAFYALLVYKLAVLFF